MARGRAINCAYRLKFHDTSLPAQILERLSERINRYCLKNIFSTNGIITLSLFHFANHLRSDTIVESEDFSFTSNFQIVD